MTKHNNVPFVIRQGDVLVRAVDHIPGGAKVLPAEKDHRVTLALGEATGHHHSFFDARVRMFRDDGLGRTFLRVGAGAGGDALLKHQEHTAIPVPPGDYEVLIQHQYTPAAIQRVED